MTLFDDSERKQLVKVIRETGGIIGKEYIEKKVYRLNNRLIQLRIEYAAAQKANNDELKVKLQKEANEIKAELAIYK